jgi:hypothetical protein
VEENASARIEGLQASLAILALATLLALFFTRLLPTRAITAPAPEPVAAAGPAA